MRDIFHRSSMNPIISHDDLPLHAAAVYNPGATMQNGETVLLLRVEDDAGFSSIHVARSTDGVVDWRIDPDPILKHHEDDWRYEEWGCEDARVIYSPVDKCWYITYTAYSPAGPAIGLARSDDLITAERVCLFPSPSDKDGALLPTMIGDRWVLLHRPESGGHQDIWSASSTDLIHWGNPHCVLTQSSGPAWDAVKVGIGPPPIHTELGWLLIYHGVKQYGSDLVYRVGIALLDHDTPNKVIARSKRWVFQAQAPYEVSGFMPNVVFPTGTVLRGDELWMYYGAADTCVCLAIARVDDILAELTD